MVSKSALSLLAVSTIDTVMFDGLRKLSPHTSRLSIRLDRGHLLPFVEGSPEGMSAWFLLERDTKIR